MFEIGAGDNQGHIRIDTNGHITQPLQPAFFARVQSGSSMTDLAVNTYHTVTFNEEIFDQNADYNNSTYTFTAPVTGRYHFDCRLYLLEVPSNTTYIYFSLVTSNNDILMGFLLGVPQLTFGFVCITIGSRTTKSVTIGLLMLTETIFAPVCVWLFFSYGYLYSMDFYM